MEEQYKELFYKLADALGWTNVVINNYKYAFFSGVFGTPADWKERGMDEGMRCSMPNWIMDDGAALRLAVDHNLDIMSGSGGPVVSAYTLPTSGNAIYDEHEDRYTAWRIAIAKAVIAKLERR